MPSTIQPGLSVFTSRISMIVGKKSEVTATVVTFLNDEISAGECIIPGVRMPPSKIDALPAVRRPHSSH